VWTRHHMIINSTERSLLKISSNFARMVDMLSIVSLSHPCSEGKWISFSQGVASLDFFTSVLLRTTTPNPSIQKRQLVAKLFLSEWIGFDFSVFADFSCKST